MSDNRQESTSISTISDEQLQRDRERMAASCKIIWGRKCSSDFFVKRDDSGNVSCAHGFVRKYRDTGVGDVLLMTKPCDNSIAVWRELDRKLALVAAQRNP